MSKRDSGSIVKTKGGKWKATVTVGYDPETGKQIRRSKTLALKKEALEWIEKTKNEYFLVDISACEINFSQLIDLWLNEKKNTVQTSTFITCQSNARLVRRLSGENTLNISLRSLRNSHFQMIIDQMVKSGYEKSYIISTKAFLNSVMRFAENNQIIVRNPITKIVIPKEFTQGGNSNETTTNRDSFNNYEIECIREYYKLFNFGEIIFIMINTGLRTQEICALTNESVIKDGEQYYLSVTKAMTKVSSSQWKPGSPKTKNSIRKIPINNEVFQCLTQRLLTSRYVGGVRPILEVNNDFIKQITFRKKYFNFFKLLNEYLKGKNLESVRCLPPHCCRRTYATTIIKKGIEPHYAKYLLGHSKISTTMDIYTKIKPSDCLDSLKKIGMA